MQAKGEYCITAGEFAKMCQTTRDTLRYYERQGILVPKKNPVNGYRYYSYAQISSYYFIRTFRGLDCSVGDIKEYLLGGEEIRFDEFVEQQYDKLLLMRQELDRKIRTIAGTRQILDQIRIADQGHPVIREIGDSWYFIFTEVISKPATSSGEIEKDIRRHLKRCDNPGITEEGCRNKEDIVEMEPGEYLAAVCRESDGDIRDTYREIKDLMKKESKQFDSDIYSLSIVNVIDPNEEHKYLKYIFAKVKQI